MSSLYSNNNGNRVDEPGPTSAPASPAADCGSSPPLISAAPADNMPPPFTSATPANDMTSPVTDCGSSPPIISAAPADNMPTHSLPATGDPLAKAAPADDVPRNLLAAIQPLTEAITDTFSPEHTHRRLVDCVYVRSKSPAYTYHCYCDL